MIGDTMPQAHLKVRPNDVIADYLSVFTKANPGRPRPRLAYEGGWYVFRAEQGYVRGRYRRHRIEQLQAELQRRIRAADKRSP